MTTTTPADAKAAPIDGHRADLIGHVLIGVGALLHTIGGKILRARNEQLTSDLHDAHELIAAKDKYTGDVGQRLYHLGREHERDHVPAPESIADVAVELQVDKEPAAIGDELEHGGAELAADPA